MHKTHKRPPTEPYDLWDTRRKEQAKDLKVYQRGKVLHQGSTYIAPICPLCNKKERKCKCWKIAR